jgi:acetyl-CoA carboxylase carboxyl transferase subunit alpha
VAGTYLDFELPLAPLDDRIEELRAIDARGLEETRELKRLEAERRRVERTVYSGLSAFQRVQLARHVDRPQTCDYVERLCSDFFELHGDRHFGDDPAIVGGLATYRGEPLVVVGHQRGHSAQERQHRNIGMASPEGYRKTLRLFRLAERLRIPILTFVDTQGAYPGVGAEERGQAEAIARNLRTMTLLRVPIVSVVIGEGGSGGALALGVGDRVLMQEYSCFSVISPEGCSSILYRDNTPENVARAAEALHLTSDEVAKIGFVDEIIPEPLGGAHRNPRRAAEALAKSVGRHLTEIKTHSVPTLLARRYEKFRRVGRDGR